MVLKITSLGGAHLYGEERTRLGSDNSISYGAHSAVSNVDENTAGNSAKIALHTHRAIQKPALNFEDIVLLSVSPSKKKTPHYS